MLRKSLKLRNLGVLIALVALLVVVPQPVAAQEIPACTTTSVATLELTGTSSTAIEPISGQEILRVGYRYRAQEQAYSINPIQITFSVAGAPSWANVVQATKVIFIPLSADAPTDESGNVELTVSVNADAPAYQKAQFELQAEAAAGTCVTGAEDSADVEITPGFLERWSAEFDQKILQFGQNSAFQIPVTIQNAGNGGIEVQFEQIEREESEVDGRALNVVVPSGFKVVGSQAQGTEGTATFNVDVQTPFRNGYMNERFPLAVELGGRSADQSDVELTPATLRAVVQTQGVFVPGFEMATALLAVIGIAMIQMRRRS